MKTKNTKPRPTAALVDEFLSIKPDPRLLKRGPTSPGKLEIAGSNGDLRISYELSPNETAILRLIHEATGVSIEWLARDAIGWGCSYMADLVDDGTGQLDDLIDLDDGAAITGTKGLNAQRTRAFYKAIRARWDEQRVARGFPTSQRKAAAATR